MTTVDGERTNTMEYEAKLKGQEWVNHAYEVKNFKLFLVHLVVTPDMDGADRQV